MPCLSEDVGGSPKPMPKASVLVRSLPGGCYGQWRDVLRAVGRLLKGSPFGLQDQRTHFRAAVNVSG